MATGVLLTPDAARRTRAVVKRVEAQGVQPTKRRRRDKAPLGGSGTGLWVRVSAAVSLAPHIWEYTGILQRLIGGTVQDVAAATEYTFQNSTELNNTGSGVEGNGVNYDGADYPDNFDMQPIPTDAVVFIRPMQPEDTSTVLWLTQYENADDGTC